MAIRIIMPKITLPVGPTDNRRLIFAPRLRRMVSSPEYRTWKEWAVNEARRQWKGNKVIQPTFENQIAYKVKIWLPDKRTDQANYDKSLRDVLTEAGVWEDDKFCYPIFSPCEIDKKHPRIEVILEI